MSYLASEARLKCGSCVTNDNPTIVYAHGVRYEQLVGREKTSLPRFSSAMSMV